MHAQAAVARSTKAGVQTPATPSSLRRHSPAGTSLNKGRSTNPGNTTRSAVPCSNLSNAQQRPEYKPRQHIKRLNPTQTATGRSTKAGVQTPATLLCACRCLCALSTLNKGRSTNPGNTCENVIKPLSAAFAQQRPEYKPRQHTAFDGVISDSKDRSTKAGVQTPATRCSAAPQRPHRIALNKGRSTNPGNTSNPSIWSRLNTFAQQRPEYKPRQHG